MNIPKKVKVGAHSYKVSFEKDLSTNHAVMGQSRHAKGQIVLDTEQMQTQLEDTFIHEILHAIQFQCNFLNTRDGQVEEDAIARLAPALLQVIKDNPNLFN